MNKQCISVALALPIALGSIGCRVRLSVNPQGFASVQLKKGQKVTWTADHPNDKIQIIFPDAPNQSACKEYAKGPFPETAAHSVTCTIKSDYDTAQTLGYQVIVTEPSHKGPVEVTASRAAVDCHYCDVSVVGKPVSVPTSPPPPPAQGPRPFKNATPSNATSGIHFTCKGNAPYLDDNNSVVTIKLSDLSDTPRTIKTWVADTAKPTSWAVTFAAPPLCDEGLQLQSTDPVNYRCTVTKTDSTPTLGKHSYNLAAVGCGAGSITGAIEILP